MTSLPDAAKALLDAPEFATVATLQADGSPQTSVVWIARDGEDVVFSTIHGRRKTDNLRRDPRLSVLVYPRDAPYQYLEVRGEAAIEEDPSASLIHALAQKYTGAERYTGDDGTDNRRVVVRVTPTKVHWRD